jgi:hypothetical protein
MSPYSLIRPFHSLPYRYISVSIEGQWEAGTGIDFTRTRAVDLGRHHGLLDARDHNQNAVTLAATVNRLPLRPRTKERVSPGVPCIAL